MYKSKLIGTGAEYFTAFFLKSFYDMDIIYADNEGFDLVANDEDGVFRKGKLAISVKGRLRLKRGENFNMQDSYEKLKEQSKKWGAEPYFAFVAFHKFENKIHLVIVHADFAKQNLWGGKKTNEFKFKKIVNFSNSHNLKHFVFEINEKINVKI